MAKEEEWDYLLKKANFKVPLTQNIKQLTRHPSLNLLDSLKEIEKLFAEGEANYKLVHELNPVRLRLKLRDLSCHQVVREFVMRNHSKVLDEIRSLWKEHKPSLEELFSGKKPSLEKTAPRFWSASFEVRRKEIGLMLFRTFRTIKWRQITDSQPREPDTLAWAPSDTKAELYSVLTKLFQREAKLLKLLTDYYGRITRIGPVKSRVSCTEKRSSARAICSLAGICAEVKKTQNCFSCFLDLLEICASQHKCYSTGQKRNAFAGNFRNEVFIAFEEHKHDLLDFIHKNKNLLSYYQHPQMVSVFGSEDTFGTEFELHQNMLLTLHDKV